MKTFWKITIPVLLLALLLIGGGLLYRELAPRVRPSMGETEESVPAERHRGEYAEREAATPAPEAAAEEATAAEPEPEKPAVEETAEPAAVLSENLTADFSVLDEDGNTVSLSDYFGTPIIVNMWATWCPPCRAELPYFDAAAKRYEGQIRFMMVDLTDGVTDTVESATAFAREENGYSFPLYFDPDYSSITAYDSNAIPVTLFIRADGSLLHRQIGSMDEVTLESYIQQLLEDN